MIYNFIGMRRTGHHGISHWLTAQTHANTKVYVNKLHGSAIKTREPVHIRKGSVGGSLIELRGYEDEWDHPEINTEYPTILVMRSVKNMVASRLKGGRNTSPEDYDLYRKHARTILGKLPNPYKVFGFIYYDRWFTDPAYRARIVAGFNRNIAPATFTDKDFSRLDSTLQSGSSWTGCEHDGNTQEMPVLERYKQVDMPEIPQDILELSRRVEEKYK